MLLCNYGVKRTLDRMQAMEANSTMMLMVSSGMILSSWSAKISLFSFRPGFACGLERGNSSSLGRKLKAMS